MCEAADFAVTYSAWQIMFSKIVM